MSTTPEKKSSMPLLWKIGLGLLFLIVVLLAVIALQPATFQVERKTTIAAPAAVVFAQVNDFHNWDKWSPWAKLDPGMKQTYDGAESGTGAKYHWVGNDEVGEGNMAITDSRPDKLIRIDLEFLKPFKNSCVTEFTFEPDSDQTRLAWKMSGKNTFLTKAFHLFINMDKMIGSDFEKGLAQIKSIAEAQAKGDTPTGNNETSDSGPSL